jgi:dipeptidyl aminopeptidase/acylaminoacyl peptidase
MPILAFFIRGGSMNQIKIDQFLDFRFISNLQTNCSQNRLAFLVAKSNIKKNEYVYDLWKSDGLKHHKCVSLKNKSSYLFETDHTLLFAYEKSKAEEKKAKEEKVSFYYRYYLSDGRVEKAYEFPFPGTILNVLNNQLLLKASLTSKQHHLYLDDKDERKKFIKEDKDAKLYEDINEIPFYFNGTGHIANIRNQLFLYDIQSKTIKPLVDSDFNVGIVKVSDDLKKIYYTGSQTTGIKRLTTHIFCYHMDTHETEILYHEDDFSVTNMYLVNGSIIMAGTDMKDFGINQNPDFFILKHKKLELLTIYRGSIGNSVGSDVRLGDSKKDVVVKDKLYFVSTVDDHCEIHSLDLNGTIKMDFQFNGAIDGLIYMNNQFYIVGQYRQKLQEIYQLHLIENKQLQLTRFNQSIMKNKHIATPKEIIVKGLNHVVKGFVLYPKDYDAKSTYPAILNIHGGPKTVYGKVYYHEMQYWANQGYFVCYANPRGSDGKGDAFADIRGKYGTIDYDDLMMFTDHVIQKIPQINTKQFFVTGGSYGGFMTNWIVGHNDRFKAAATQRSISNWLSFHGTSDIGFYFSKDQTAGHPMTDMDLLYEQSPIKYTKNVKTPLLFIHSDQDYRCPIEQAMQFYTLLKEQGLDTKFIWFKGETHELSRSGKPQARIKRLSDITTWFETHK